MLCPMCNIDFEKIHFNQKYCGSVCKRKAVIATKKKYKSSEKGKISEEKWIKSEKRKENEKVYRQNPIAKKKAVIRNIRCLKNSPELQEKKRTKSLEFGRSEKGREINNISVSKYRKTEKGKATSKKQKYMRRALGEITQETIMRIQKENNCYYCGKECKEDKTIDHKIPVKKGGTNHENNLVVACRSCNCSKHDKTEEEYKRWRSENKM
jgi:5-methylcytosine-specific restriction endonuclease McrA